MEVKRLAWLALAACAFAARAQPIADLQTAVTQAQASLAAAQQQLVAATAAGAAAQTQLAALQAQISALSGQLAAAQAQATADATTIAGLKAQVAALTAQIAAFSCPVPAPCPICPAPAVCPLPPAPPVVVVPPPLPTGSAVLTWTANACPDPTGGQCATGYRVYYGTASGVYMQPKGTGLSTTAITYTVSGLANGRWYFAVTAQNAVAESGFSNEVFKDIGTVPAPVPAPTPAPAPAPVPAIEVTVPPGFITDSLGVVWYLYPAYAGMGPQYVIGHGDPAIGTGMALCYSGGFVYAKSDPSVGALLPGQIRSALPGLLWYKWTDNAALPNGGSFSQVSTPGAGCV
jgi:hypothetical protein